jgi:hypothetical protein
MRFLCLIYNFGAINTFLYHWNYCTSNPPRQVCFLPRISHLVLFFPLLSGPFAIPQSFSHLCFPGVNSHQFGAKLLPYTSHPSRVLLTSD